MMDQREATLDELLNEPTIRKVMARDGVRASDIRRLMQQARIRRTLGSGFGPVGPVLTTPVRRDSIGDSWSV